jgi:D-glycero-alpha-D-manno-heptose-7-phosphate kinase
MYEAAMKQGALGGKLLGAGGGGFFLFYVPTWEVRQRVISVISLYNNAKPLDFKFSYEGSKIIYNDRGNSQ